MCPVCSQEWGDDVEVCPNDGVALVQLETGNGAGGSGLVGQVVDGRYKIERIVGKGGMGTVYACRHVVVGKEFAIKVLRPGIERSEEVLQRFIREAQAANAIRSRHICEMTDFGQLKGHGGAFYVVMELLVGDSLTKRLRNEDLDRSGLLHIFEQVAQTLEKAHQAGILHRDLKPDNVVIVEDDGDPTFVKLVDFGIAKMMHAAAGELTETGVILGTPYYMSPEQARGEELDARTDIYSLGVMLYRAFTGRLPFVADTAMGVLTRHITEKPQTPSKLVEIDRPLERLILRCMEKKPIDRFQTMTEVAEAIRSLPPFEGSVADTGSDDMRSTRDERTSVPSESPTPASLPAASSDRLPTHPSAEAWPPPSGDPSGVSEPRTRPSIPA
ncbi:MAG: serine/threonine-protein kinase, partial [Myxococcota bacterium]